MGSQEWSKTLHLIHHDVFKVNQMKKKLM